MISVRLSICIATYNRAAFIGQTLQSIIEQLTDEVEVVIADGASTDDTEHIVRKFSSQSPNLKYIRLPVKGGFDQDYCKAVEAAQGDYCWVFTDDDILRPGAIDAVLKAIQKNYNLIVVNAEVKNPNLSVCLQPKRVRLDQDKEYNLETSERDQLLADAGTYLSFIGAVVLRRDLWNQREKQQYFGTEFIHMGVVFQKQLPGKALVTAFPWITIRYGNAQWVSRHFAIWMFKWPDLIWSFSDYSDWAKARITPREPWHQWSRLLLDRATGHYSLEDYDKWLASRANSFLQKSCLRAIASIPIGPLNFFARIVARFILRKVPSIGLYDLESWHKNKN
jgi:glycosyltransferase involved in cell wall biosynthesis